MKKLAIYRFLYALRHNLPVLLLYLAVAAGFRFAGI